MATHRSRVVVSWSSGKDSAFCLHALRQRQDMEVVGLLSTLNSRYRRISLHGVSEAVLEAQARACELKLHKVMLPDPCSDEEYRSCMATAVAQLEAERVEAIAFGDLFLEDVRSYREKHLARTRLKPLFPVWGVDTSEFARNFIHAGFKAIIVCVDTQKLDPSVLGSSFDLGLLSNLPRDVDPCGENGEFHTLVVDGPIFCKPLSICLGKQVRRGQFAYVDVKVTGSKAAIRRP